jgi:hypothetical protein
MGRIEALIKEMGRAGTAIADAVKEADAMLASAGRATAVRAHGRSRRKTRSMPPTWRRAGSTASKTVQDLVSLVRTRETLGRRQGVAGSVQKSIDLAVTNLETRGQHAARHEQLLHASQERSSPSWATRSHSPATSPNTRRVV